MEKAAPKALQDEKYAIETSDGRSTGFLWDLNSPVLSSPFKCFPVLGSLDMGEVTSLGL